jgi:hypothetical protein
MEVHHHAHPSPNPGHRKKWTHYFWEFIMLFLAVFCGFLAEYQLEHKIEKDREKQFIVSMIADLQDDVAHLDDLVAQENRGKELLDTLILLLNDPAKSRQQGDDLYYIARLGPRHIPFSNNSRTFDQLRNSGGFRLIRKKDASNRIMEYYNLFTQVRLLENNYNEEFNNYKQVGAKILNAGILRRQESESGAILRSTDNPALLTYDPSLLNELAFHTLQMNGSRRSKIHTLANLRNHADSLAIFLKEKYHVK